MTEPWQFVRSTILRRLGKLTLREDVWRLPTGGERVYPLLHVGLSVGVVPFVDAEHVLLVRTSKQIGPEESSESRGAPDRSQSASTTIRAGYHPLNGVALSTSKTR